VTAKTHRRTRVVVTPTKPLKSPPAPPAEYWLRSILTDHDGYFDLGAVLVGFVGIFMCAASGYNTIVLHNSFNAMEFGTGVGAMLGGFAVYKWGDAKRAPGTTTTTMQRTETTASRKIDIPRD